MGRDTRTMIDLPARLGTAFVRRAEDLNSDPVSAVLMRLAKLISKPTWSRNLLSGTTIGHPLHPMLTDVPIGAWLAAGVLDTVGGRESSRAATTLVATGMVAAVPTALSGLSDWGDTYGPETRVGFVHSAGVHLSLALYAGSLVNRLHGNLRRGKAFGFAGLGVLLASAYLGGHLSFVRAMVVNHTAFEERPTDWTDVAADADLADGVSLRVRAGEAAVLLRRDAGRVVALANTCSHMGGPLDEGTVADGCITCPWHGSVFRLEDGRIVRGPATVPQPCYDVRVADGRIEVRARS